MRSPLSVLLGIAVTAACPDGSAARIVQSTPPQNSESLLSTFKTDQGCAKAVSPEQMKVVARDGKRIADWIANAPAPVISAILPRMVSMFSGAEEEDQRCAGHVLADVAFRSDSATLLRGHVSSIGAVLNTSQDARIERGAGFILTTLRPEPPREVAAPLLEFIKSPNRDTRLQASAIEPLARLASELPPIVDAIEAFWAKRLDASTKEITLNALGNSRTKNQQLMSIVITAFNDESPSVRSIAVQVIRRMGNDAIRLAVPELRKLIENPDLCGESAAGAAEQVCRSARELVNSVQPQGKSTDRPRRFHHSGEGVPTGGMPS
jgi:hypothetical protein